MLMLIAVLLEAAAALPVAVAVELVLVMTIVVEVPISIVEDPIFILAVETTCCHLKCIVEVDEAREKGFQRGRRLLIVLSRSAFHVGIDGKVNNRVQCL
jgi:hypothetical protein